MVLTVFGFGRDRSLKMVETAFWLYSRVHVVGEIHHHSHLRGKFSGQLGGSTLGEWSVARTLYLIIHKLRFCFLAVCGLVRAVTQVLYWYLLIMVFVQ